MLSTAHLFRSDPIQLLKAKTMFLESVFPDKYYSKYTPPTILDPDPNDLVLLTNKAKKLAQLILDHWAVDVPFTHHPQTTADGLLRSCLEQCRAYYKPQIVRWLKTQTDIFCDLNPPGKTYHFSRKSKINCLVTPVEDSDLIKLAITPVHNWSEPAKVSFDSLEETLASILWHFHAVKIQKVDKFEWDPYPVETRPSYSAIVEDWFNVSGYLFDPAPGLSSTPKEYERLAAALEVHSERLLKALEAKPKAEQSESDVVNKEPYNPKPDPQPTDPSPSPDGPVDIFSWSHNGIIYPGMKPTSWKLAKHLWEQKERKVKLNDLAEPVFGDHAQVITKELVGNHRKLANKFFESSEIPLRVETKSSFVFLISR